MAQGQVTEVAALHGGAGFTLKRLRHSRLRQRNGIDLWAAPVCTSRCPQVGQPGLSLSQRCSTNHTSAAASSGPVGKVWRG